MCICDTIKDNGQTSAVSDFFTASLKEFKTHSLPSFLWIEIKRLHLFFSEKTCYFRIILTKVKEPVSIKQWPYQPVNTEVALLQ